MIKVIRGKKILTLSTGNKKLVGDENNAYLIHNIPAKKTCPYATKLCLKYCYANKSERLHPTVRSGRHANYMETLEENFIENMTNTIKYYMNKKDIKGKKIWFRIHESGDFYSQEYFDKWAEIAKQFPELSFLAYTKSVKFIEETTQEIPNNFTIRYSVWADTKPEELKKAEKLNLPIYTAYPEKELEQKVNNEGYTKCDCECINCKKCFDRNINKIAVAIH